MNKKRKSYCYACNEIAVSKEHAPPYSFFPEGHRKNLITVPSCKKHNQDNSDDVEYIRDIITSCFQVNEVGFKLFTQKTYKSVTRNRRLIEKIFSTSNPVLLNGFESRAIDVDLNNFYKVFELIGKALYYHKSNTRIKSDFRVMPASLFFSPFAPENNVKQYENILSSLGKLKYNVEKSENPEVFNYSSYVDEKNRIVYKLVLYEGFIVYLINPNVTV